MGRLEKIVVLTVLFLVAVILAVSLNREDVVAGPAEPEQMRADLGELAGPAALEPAESAEDEPFRAPPRALSSTLEDTPADSEPNGTRAITPDAETLAAPQIPPDAEPRPEPSKPRKLLRTSAGLESSLVPELMLYTWKQGDSFTSVADRYYGSRLEVGRLRAANEGREESAIAAGEKIFVPVEAVAATERLGRSSDQAGQWHGGVYTVQSGDILGTIAQKTYGSASKWKRIYEANLDVLTSPDALKVGMRLRIPAQ